MKSTSSLPVVTSRIARLVRNWEVAVVNQEGVLGNQEEVAGNLEGVAGNQEEG